MHVLGFTDSYASGLKPRQVIGDVGQCNNEMWCSVYAYTNLTQIPKQKRNATNQNLRQQQELYVSLKSENQTIQTLHVSQMTEQCVDI